MRTYSTQQGNTAQLKDSANLKGIVPASVDPIIEAAAPVYERFGKDLVITSGTDGQHMQGSLHYVGKALDLRASEAWGYSDRVRGQIAGHLRRELGPNYDIVIEPTHIHAEHDPS